ncbi:hypothetical protein EH223_13165 [candidate division KSB1 bacterium]|nr:AAA family ATPase [candidate division KSB1 bacterium]RQW02134.1 MAG: hypothetical protein EH223_13165 [candidate division KSB1 bacterium]
MSMTRTPKIIAIAGGKGGVGKTIFACMLGICLAGFKRRTILVDLDFSGADVHGYLDVPRSDKSLNAYFSGRSTHLGDVVQPTLFDKLDAISLQSDVFDAQACKPWQKRRLFREFQQLKADYIILDLGAASSILGLDSFLMADYGILLSTNDMFSIINTYSFIRSTLLRSLKRRFYDTPHVLRILDECGLLVDGKSVKPLNTIIEQFELDIQEKFLELEHLWMNFHPKVILNFAQESERFDDFFLLGPVTKDLLNVDLDYWGHIRFDDDVRRAVRSKRPDKLFSATSKASEDVVRFVVRNIIANEVHAGDQKSSMWLQKDANIFRMFQEEDSIICTPKCLLWNNCSARSEGCTCSKMHLELMKKAG